MIGPYGANIFNPRGWGGGSDDVTNTITLEFTRVVLAIGVFAKYLLAVLGFVVRNHFRLSSKFY